MVNSRLSRDFFFLFIILFAMGSSVPFANGQSLKGSVPEEGLLDKAGIPSIINYTAKKYQGHPNNYSIVQDKEGILYFGNLWGVLEFNGTDWRTISLPDRSSCTALAIDQNGTVIVGGRNEIGYLRKDSLGRRRYVSFNHLLPSNSKNFDEIWKIFVTGDGIYFSSNSVLLFKDYNKEKIDLIKNSNNAFLENGQVYTSDYTGIYKVSKNKTERLSNSEKLVGQFVNIMGTIKGRTMISTSESGMFLYDGKELKEWRSEINKSLRNYNPQKVINLEDNFLVFATELGGVFITDIEGRILYNIGKTSGLLSNTVTDIFCDKDRNLWLTLNNSITQIQIFKEYSFINNFSGVSGIPYSSAIYNGKLYLATSEGLFYQKLEQGGALSKGFTKLPDFSGVVWNLQVIDDKLFCGHAITCHLIDHDQKAKMVYNAGSWKFLPLPEGRILMGTYKGLHYLEKVNNGWKYLSKIEGFEESSRYFVMDKLGDIWVSHGSKGLYQLRLDNTGNKVVQLKLHSSAGGKKIGNNAVNIVDDQVVVAAESGIFRYDRAKEKLIQHESLSKALKENSAASMVINQNESLVWVLDKSGVLIQLQQDKNGRYKILSKTEKFKGSLIKDFEHVNPSTFHSVLVGTQDGFVIYKPGATHVKEASSQTFISQVEASSELLWQGHSNLPKLIKGQIPFNQNTLTFYFTSNSYDEAGNNQFSYYLQGFEAEKCSEWSATGFKEYTNLAPGKYTFHVKSRNVEGITSKATAIAFEILPPWYRTSLAYIAYSLLGFAIGALISVEIRKRFKRQRHRLELQREKELWKKQKEWEAEELKRKKAMVELEQEKLYMEALALQQKERLLEQEKEQEKKIMEMQKEKLESEISYKNNELSSLTLHITQKNELLSKIRNQTKKLKQESTDQDSLKTLQQMEMLIQKGLSTSKEWEKFTEHFDFVHNGFLQRLKQQYPDLKSNSLKLCAYLKMRVSSKQIAILMNTAPASVMKARYRLRVKFNLEKDEGLEDFLNNF